MYTEKTDSVNRTQGINSTGEITKSVFSFIIKNPVIIKSAALIPLILFIVPLLTTAQDNPNLDDATKVEIITKVTKLIEERYVFPELGVQMSAHIKSEYKEGSYGSFNKIIPFCNQLTLDLRSKCNNDKHLFVFYSPEEAHEVRVHKELLPQKEIEDAKKMYENWYRRQNYGFRKLEILEGNIGYIKLDYFPNIIGAETCIAAMKFLEGADALIIDLRDNGGGENLGGILQSYFF